MKLADTIHTWQSLKALVQAAESGDERAILALSPGDLEAYNQALAVFRIYGNIAKTMLLPGAFPSADYSTMHGMHPACAVLMQAMTVWKAFKRRPSRSELNGTDWPQFAKNEYFTEVVNACLDKLKDTEYGALFAEDR